MARRQHARTSHRSAREDRPPWARELSEVRYHLVFISTHTNPLCNNTSPTPSASSNFSSCPPQAQTYLSSEPLAAFLFDWKGIVTISFKYLDRPSRLWAPENKNLSKIDAALIKRAFLAAMEGSQRNPPQRRRLSLFHTENGLHMGVTHPIETGPPPGPPGFPTRW